MPNKLIRIYQHDEDYLYSPKEGFSYILNVFSKSKNKYIGWIEVRSLFSNNVDEALQKYPALEDKSIDRIMAL